MKLEDVMREVNNFFEKTKYRGKFKIENNSISLPLLEGQYFRIVGSVFNDGVHQYPAVNLKDEVFVGEVWGLAVPQSFLDLVSEIGAWSEQYGDTVHSPYNSESFGGYSYSKSYASRGDGSGSGASDWQDIFKTRLSRWRKI